MAVENSLVLIKPDAMRRALVGPVLTKIDETRLSLVATALKRVDVKLAEAHYAQHIGKPFFPQLLDYITGKLHSAPGDRVLALVYRGENAIQKIRALAGNTNPEKAAPDTVRGMFGRITTAGVFENVLHASATPLEAEREIKLWFEPRDIIDAIYPAKNDVTGLMWERIPSVAELV